MSAPLQFLFDVNDPSRNRLIQSVFLTSTYSVGDEVRNDKALAVQIQPVTVNPPGSYALYAPDWSASDTFQLAVGMADTAPTGGTFKITAGATTTNLTAIVYNVTAAALQTPLSAAFVTEGKSACTVTLVATGVYQIVANNNGAIATGFLVGDGANLIPLSSAYVIEDSLGSASLPYKLLLVVRQSPMCFAAPSIALTTAGVTLSTTAAGSSTSNKIQKITFDATDTYDGTYKITASCGAAQSMTAISIANPTNVTVANHGFPNGATVVFAGSNSTPTVDGSRTITVIDADTFTVAVNVTVAGTQGTAQYTQDTTCGIAKPRMSVQELGAVLGGHPQIFYNEPGGTANNINVTQNGQNYFVEFLGSLGNSTSPALTLTNIDLIAPQGVSGTLNFNTLALYEYSLTQSGETFDLLISITRTRSTGEVRTIFGPTTITISKDLVDPSTMVPNPLPSYYTAAQSDARYGQLAAVNTWTLTNNFGADINVIGNGNFSGAVNSTNIVTGAGLVTTASLSLWLTQTATSYTVLTTDTIIGVTSTASARTITLPNAALVPNQVFVVKDQSGAAATNNITVKSTAGTLDGVAAGTGIPINANYGSLSFYSNGTNYFIF